MGEAKKLDKVIQKHQFTEEADNRNLSDSEGDDMPTTVYRDKKTRKTKERKKKRAMDDEFSNVMHQQHNPHYSSYI